MRSDLRSEGSRTVKSGTDEQERHKRLYKVDKRAQQRNVQIVTKFYIVDVAVIGGRKRLLPGEVSEVTSNYTEKSADFARRSV